MKYKVYHLSFLLTLFLFNFSCFGQSHEYNVHNFYYQKTVFKIQDNNVVGTRIFDSLKVYGLVLGFDSLHLSKLTLVGQFKGSSQFSKANFIAVLQSDTVLIDKHFALNLQKPDSAIFFDVSSVLFGTNISSDFNQYDLYYSEILNFAEISQLRKPIALCVYPYTHNGNEFFKILELNTTDEGLYQIFKTVIDCRKPHQPYILSKSSSVVSSRGKHKKLQLKLAALDGLDVGNHCLSSNIPMLIMNSANYFYYSLNCDTHTSYPKQPLQFALYLEQIAFKMR